LGFAGGTAASGIFLLFFDHLYMALDPNPLFWLKIFLETKPKSASLEPLNDFLAYQERKL